MSHDQVTRAQSQPKQHGGGGAPVDEDKGPLSTDSGYLNSLDRNEYVSASTFLFHLQNTPYDSFSYHSLKNMAFCFNAKYNQILGKVFL